MVMKTRPPAPIPVANARCPRCGSQVYWSRARWLHCLIDDCAGPTQSLTTPGLSVFVGGLKAQVLPLYASAITTLEHIAALVAGRKASENLGGLIDALHERAERIATNPDSFGFLPPEQ